MPLFEEFISTQPGEDIFGKTHRLSEALDGSRSTAADGLGIHATGSAQPVVNLELPDGNLRECVMLGSNSYLNLSTHPAVLEGARKALETYGYGMGAVSLYAGMTDLHRELEQRIAAFYNAEDAIVFPGGYATNVGVISALCGKDDIIINDSANHASIFDGSVLSRATMKCYIHGNIEHLEKILSRLPDDNRGRLLITDGVFSMSGDLAQLDTLVDLARRHHARIMVDDAHGIGVVGPTGRGTAEHYGVMDKIDLHIGMLSKAPAGLGGFCAASREVVRYLRLYARTYFFSTALPAPVVGGLIEVFKLLEADNAGRAELWRNIGYIRGRLGEAGFDIGPGGSGVVPLYVRNETVLNALYADLLAAGVYTNIVSYPACRRRECRLRLCVMKDLSKSQIDYAVDTLVSLGGKRGII